MECVCSYAVTETQPAFSHVPLWQKYKCGMVSQWYGTVLNITDWNIPPVAFQSGLFKELMYDSITMKPEYVLGVYTLT